MGTLLNFNILKKKKAQQKQSNNLNQVIPKELELFDQTKVVLKDIVMDRISNHALENYFRKSVSAVFNIHGEIHGHAVAQLDSRNMFETETEELGITEIFVETTNIILGHILSDVDQSLDLMGHLGAPLLINENMNSTLKDHSKKMRILSVLNRSISTSQFYQLDYEIDLNGYKIPFHIFLIFNIDESQDRG